MENVAVNRTVAFGSFNASLHAVSQALISSPAHHDIIAKEGTSILIECKLNISQYEHILWYNSRGHLLEQKDEGEFSYCFLSIIILLLNNIGKPLGLYYKFSLPILLFLQLRDKESKASPLPSEMLHGNYTWVLLFQPIHPALVPHRITLFKSHPSIPYRRNESSSYSIQADSFIYYCSCLNNIFQNA